VQRVTDRDKPHHIVNVAPSCKKCGRVGGTCYTAAYASCRVRVMSPGASSSETHH
jgi:hypothetical protein